MYCDVDAIVYEQSAQRAAETVGGLHQSARRYVAAAGVQGNFTRGCDCLSARVEIATGENLIVRYGVQTRERGSQLNRSPRMAPRPRSQSTAAILCRPAGCTSRN